VAIQSSAVTLDVNIASSAVTLDINVTNPVLQVGQTKPALSFDGEDDYVRVPDSPSLDLTKPFTIECWFRWDMVQNNWVSLVRKTIDPWAPPNGVYWVGISYTNKIMAAVVVGGEKKEHTSDFQPEVGRWYQVVFVYPGGVYVNGSKIMDFPDYGDCDTNDQPLIIGASRWDREFFGGIISLVRIYRRALSESEIQQLYQNPQAPPTNGLVLWLNFDEGSGTVAHDKSGNGNDGTIYGATWVSEAGEVPALVNVNLSAQTVTMEVKIVASDVTLNVAIQSSAVTLDVNITGSSVTLDVNVVGTANVNITDAIVNISSVKLMDTGTVLIKSGYVSGGTSTTIYTVPAGKRAYVYYACLLATSISTAGEGTTHLLIHDGTTSYVLMRLSASPDHPYMADSVAFTFLRMEEGWEVRLFASDYARADGTVIVVEMPA